jgi:circadian clock protein KaiC
MTEGARRGGIRARGGDRQMLEPTNTSMIASSGVAGLDDVLGGGLARRRLYLVEGVPGSGKTTLAMQFLLAGVEQHETVLYVTLSETAEELRAVANSHGWHLDGMVIRELTASESALEPDDQNTMFHPSEVELAHAIKPILADVERLKPTRLVFDSLSELRLLAGTALRYRRQILALKQYFATRNCTVIMLDDLTATDHDLQMQSLAHGVVRLDQLHPEYGSDRRRLRVVKYRGAGFRGGYHDYAIRKGGIEVFPRLVAAEHRGVTVCRRLSSGLSEFDALLQGGLEEGSSTLLAGAAGTGKSSLAAQFVAAAAARGEGSAMFLFDESPSTLLSRCSAFGIELREHVARGIVEVRQVDPAELAPGELVHAIRMAVETRGCKVVVIDSLNGYLNAMPEERFLAIQLHELLMYLGQRGVVTILIAAHQGLIGSRMESPVDASYLADAVVLLRYFESKGEVRQAISVMKKRGGPHERTIREFRLEDGRISVGRVLRDFHGVLTGVPRYEGTVDPWPASPNLP